MNTTQISKTESLNDKIKFAEKQIENFKNNCSDEQKIQANDLLMKFYICTGQLHIFYLNKILESLKNKENEVTTRN